ncbi:hypothetical protein [Pelolinea submarina]|uniref:Uncharacterized protein n=1 Tax=Pelolinea submarina TaxID=913107 RepID=A0A3E0AFJ8_9CHLR|nr:hypothetical protein [Pelolinea submarina]REG10441.1 hypothetical protein DFR64_0299 [Pelolinea submarina]
MYCLYCGRELFKNARYCAFCGQEVDPQNQDLEKTEPILWEYGFFRRCWEHKKGGRWYISDNQNEYDIRQINWANDQNEFLPIIQERIDKGWELVTQPGPGSYYMGKDFDSLGTWYEVRAFVVDFRRVQKNSLSEKEQYLVGEWYSTNEPVFINPFNQNKKIKRDQLIFHSDRRFIYRPRYGNEYNGVFHEEEGDLYLSLRFPMEYDYKCKKMKIKISFNDIDLICDKGIYRRA